jgi:hypothetical protein
MNNTLNQKILSPLQPKVRSTIDIRGENHPARDEVKKLCGNPFTIQVNFQEDTDTVNHFPHVPGLIGILCTLKKDGQVLAFGRSCAVFSRLNKFVDRTISSALNGAFLSASNNAVKILESIRVGSSEMEETGEEPEMTDKQKKFLMQLVLEIGNPETREEYLTQINSGMSRYDASELISSLVPIR